MSLEKISAIILSGGKSSRMGQDKGVMLFEGKPMVVHVIDVMRTISDSIIICANSENYYQFGCPVVKDIYQDCGPVGGIHAGLVASKTDWNFVVSCDTPFLISELFLNMKDKISNQDIILPQHKNGIEPLVGIYNKRLNLFMDEKINKGEFKLQKIIKECKLSFFDANGLIRKYPQLFQNMNSLEDLLNDR